MGTYKTKYNIGNAVRVMRVPVQIQSVSVLEDRNGKISITYATVDYDGFATGVYNESDLDPDR